MNQKPNFSHSMILCTMMNWRKMMRCDIIVPFSFVFSGEQFKYYNHNNGLLNHPLIEHLEKYQLNIFTTARKNTEGIDFLIHQIEHQEV